MRKFLSGNFRKFPEISGNLPRKFPEISGNFRKFPGNFLPNKHKQTNEQTNE